MSLAAQISKLSSTIRLDFNLSNPELMQEQAALLVKPLEQLTTLKNKLNSFSSSIDSTKVFGVDYYTINSLFLIFGSALERIKFNEENELII